MSNKCVDTNGKKVRTRHNIILDEAAQTRGVEMATDDLRSFSNFLEWLLEQEWKRRGKDPAQLANEERSKAA